MKPSDVRQSTESDFSKFSDTSLDLYGGWTISGVFNWVRGHSVSKTPSSARIPHPHTWEDFSGGHNFFTLVETMWKDLDTKHSYSQLWLRQSYTAPWEAWWKMDLETRLSGSQYLLFFWASTWGLTTTCNNISGDLTPSSSLCGSFTCMQVNTHMHKIKNSNTCLHILKGSQFKLKPPFEQCFD